MRRNVPSMMLSVSFVASLRRDTCSLVEELQRRRSTQSLWSGPRPFRELKAILYIPLLECWWLGSCVCWGPGDHSLHSRWECRFESHWNCDGYGSSCNRWLNSLELRQKHALGQSYAGINVKKVCRLWDARGHRSRAASVIWRNWEYCNPSWSPPAPSSRLQSTWEWFWRSMIWYICVFAGLIVCVRLLHSNKFFNKTNPLVGSLLPPRVLCSNNKKSLYENCFVQRRKENKGRIPLFFMIFWVFILKLFILFLVKKGDTCTIRFFYSYICG